MKIVRSTSQQRLNFSEKNLLRCGGDVRKLEPKYLAKRLTIWTIDPIIQELRAIFKVHPEWFEVPKPKSVAGKNEVDYSI